jgi:hypothetical protein
MHAPAFRYQGILSLDFPEPRATAELAERQTDICTNACADL